MDKKDLSGCGKFVLAALLFAFILIITNALTENMGISVVIASAVTALPIVSDYFYQKNKKEEQERKDWLLEEKKQQEALEKEREQFAKQKEEEQKLEAERERKEKERQEWLKTHGEIYFPVRGVTFSNKNGTSRQAALKSAYKAEQIGEDLDLSFEEFEYQGQPAVAVLVNERGVGNVPAEDVDAVLEVLDRITNAQIYVEPFEDDDGDTIYRADVFIDYLK
jgi:predicted NodU family carbamoyl transferase